MVWLRRGGLVNGKRGLAAEEKMGELALCEGELLLAGCVCVAAIDVLHEGEYI